MSNYQNQDLEDAVLESPSKTLQALHILIEEECGICRVGIGWHVHANKENEREVAADEDDEVHEETVQPSGIYSAIRNEATRWDELRSK